MEKKRESGLDGSLWLENDKMEEKKIIARKIEKYKKETKEERRAQKG